MQFPHCDARILHDPEDGCKYCNMYPEWQELRRGWCVAFTGHLPDPNSDTVMCPADYARERSAYEAWKGNRIESLFELKGGLRCLTLCLCNT